MKKKSQHLVGENLDAPIQLTPAQLETVAAGAARQVVQGTGGEIGKTTLSGAHMPKLPIKVS
jgi:hypothetical protein